MVILYWTVVNQLWDPYAVEVSSYWAHLQNFMVLIVHLFMSNLPWSPTNRIWAGVFWSSPLSLWFGRSSTTSWRLVKESHVTTKRLRSVQSTMPLTGTSQAKPLGFVSRLLLPGWWCLASTLASSVAAMIVPDVVGVWIRWSLRMLRKHRNDTTGRTAARQIAQMLLCWKQQALKAEATAVIIPMTSKIGPVLVCFVLFCFDCFGSVLSWMLAEPAGRNLQFI
jgi:hypothetical protein